MKQNLPTICSSAAAAPQSIEMRYEDENIWLTQKMLADLYNVEVPTINYHLKKSLRIRNSMKILNIFIAVF